MVREEDLPTRKFQLPSRSNSAESGSRETPTSSKGQDTTYTNDDVPDIIPARQSDFLLAAEANQWLDVVYLKRGPVVCQILGGVTADTSRVYVDCFCEVCYSEESGRKRSRNVIPLSLFYEHATGHKAGGVGVKSDDICRCELQVWTRQERVEDENTLADYMCRKTREAGGQELVGLNVFVADFRVLPDRSEVWRQATVCRCDDATGELQLCFRDTGDVTMHAVALNFLHFGEVPPQEGERPCRFPFRTAISQNRSNVD